jgi:hypothetical protein
MPERFSGKVDIVNAAGSVVFTLDPDAPFFQFVYRSGSQIVMELSTSGLLGLMQNRGIHLMRLDATTGEVLIGARGLPGRLLLRDSRSRDCIVLDTREAMVLVGTAGNPGDIAVRDDSGRDVISLNGATGDIILNNADCAEDFDLDPAAVAEPGAVMVLDRDGAIQPCRSAYDKRVAGVVSGAGECKPALVLDRRPCETPRSPLALLGKVWCKVDASDAPVEAGDLLTTSATPGHAMKAADPARAFGAVLGKALRPLREGAGLIPILVSLQ